MGEYTAALKEKTDFLINEVIFLRKGLSKKIITLLSIELTKRICNVSQNPVIVQVRIIIEMKIIIVLIIMIMKKKQNKAVTGNILNTS